MTGAKPDPAERQTITAADVGDVPAEVLAAPIDPVAAIRGAADAE